MLKSSVRRQDRVVRLDNRGSGLGSRVDAELQLALLAIINGKTFHQEGAETRTSASTEGVENQEALETAAVIGNAADLVEHLVDQLLADSIVATSVVVGGILLAGDHVFRVEESTVGSRADLVNNIRFQVAVDRPWHVFSVSCVANLISFSSE